MDAQEFLRIQEAHGLSIALRAAYASDRERGVYPDGAEMFHAMAERDGKAGDPADAFDPTGHRAFYSGDKWATFSPSRAHWAKELDESHPDSVAAIQQVVTMSNSARADYIAALPEGEWKAAIEAMTDADLLDVWCLIYRQWPMPARGPGDEAIPNEPEMAARHVRILKARP